MTSHGFELNMNQLGTSQNHYQGLIKKVLVLCSAGLLRSPTAAHILSAPPFNFNTRAAGTTLEYALVPISPALVFWADEIVCMNEDQRDLVMSIIHTLAKAAPVTGKNLEGKPVHVLNIPDRFSYMSTELVSLLRKEFLTLFAKDIKS